MIVLICILSVFVRACLHLYNETYRHGFVYYEYANIVPLCFSDNKINKKYIFFCIYNSWKTIWLYISYDVWIVGDVCEKGVAAAVIVHLAAIVLHTVAHDEIVNM